MIRGKTKLGPRHRWTVVRSTKLDKLPLGSPAALSDVMWTMRLRLKPSQRPYYDSAKEQPNLPQIRTRPMIGPEPTECSFLLS